MPTDMHQQRDPEQTEIRMLRDFADLEGKHILEIGSGDGRLTWRYARFAGRVTALEPHAATVAQAKKLRPADLEAKVALTCSQAEQLPFAKKTFDRAIFAWSL
ncbi:MAG: hypothetical protein CL607_06135 [Anaerolineaceae bacterium]|nr:hypothetical protein [Anaerolineaceae bacterium]